MGPGFIVSNDFGLDVATRRTRSRLITVTLAALCVSGTFGTKLFGHAAEAELAAADVEWAFGTRGFCVFTTYNDEDISNFAWQPMDVDTVLYP